MFERDVVYLSQLQYTNLIIIHSVYLRLICSSINVLIIKIIHLYLYFGVCQLSHTDTHTHTHKIQLDTHEMNKQKL